MFRDSGLLSFGDKKDHVPRKGFVCMSFIPGSSYLRVRTTGKSAVRRGDEM
jgi:hypothetical protein